MNPVSPPKLPLKLFRLFCSDERLEELEGDLFEVYNDFIQENGTTYGKIFYWWIVLRSFRSYALKRKKIRNRGLINSSAMFFKHNLVIAWRNLQKNKTHTAINVLGLSIGVSAFLTIFTIVQFELGFNRGIPNQERVYRIFTSFTGSFTSINKGVAMPIGPYVEENFSGIETISYFQTYGEKVKIPDADGSVKDLGRQPNMAFADSSYFKTIDIYHWLAGSPSQALNDPFKVVLTDKQARTYFGNVDWLDMIDRKVVYRDSLDVFVSGIIREPDYNTDFEFTDIISYSTIKSSWLKDRFLTDWGSTNSSSQLFIKLKKDTYLSSIQMHMDDLNEFIKEKNNELDWVQKFELQPLSDLHFNTEIGALDGGRKPAHLPTLTILGVVAFAILLIAVFNFINLETAQSNRKSKEVGVRKVMGSQRAHLVGRFLTESILITLLAVLLAVPLAHYGFIFFEEFISEGVSLDYSNYSFWISLLVLVLGVGITSGIYPAWIVSSHKPVRALSSGGSSKNTGGAFIRKTLILFQFLFSQLLIVGTLAVVWQISFMLDKELGFDEEGVVYFYTPYYSPYSKQELLLNEITQMPEIHSIALQNTPPVQNGYSTSTTKYMGEEREVVTSAHRKSGDTTFLSFYGIELLAGRNLLPNDTLKELLLNETLMSDMGFSDPREAIGKTLEFNDDDHVIAGVMKNFHFRSLHHAIEPMIYLYEDEGACISMKVNMGDQLQEAIAELTDKWNEIYPEDPLTIYFMNETIERFYKAERRTSKLASIATGIAIFISCLGLFGLISYTIVQKSKEMGIRKVLGASLFQIGSILSKEFVLLIVISFIVSTPLSYYFITQWMEDFAYQTEISWWIYVLGGFASLVIALVSIGIKVWKASAANPIESLKYE